MSRGDDGLFIDSLGTIQFAAVEADFFQQLEFFKRCAVAGDHFVLDRQFQAFLRIFGPCDPASA
ncbi:MAG: hypothetical protein QM811_14940 [Pirellulales bacterium]